MQFKRFWIPQAVVTPILFIASINSLYRKLSNAALAGFLSLVCLSSEAIVEGRNPDPYKSASTVFVSFDKTREQCTGVIISANLILTAGHCLDGLSKKTSKVQVTNAGSEKHAKKLNVVGPLGRHPLYKEPTAGGKKKAGDIQYDFAYIKVSENLLQTFGITESQLPSLFVQTADIDAQLAFSTQAMVYGYGLLDAPTAFNPSPAGGFKREMLSNVTHDTALNILMSRTAEKGKGICQGDSGGGLFMAAADGQIFLAGILSGISTGTGGCGSEDSYGAYSMVSQHICWLLKDSATPVPPALTALKCD